jgi:hypothetical protein
MKSILFSKTAAALAVALTVTTLTLPSVVYGRNVNIISTLHNKFNVWDDGDISASAINPTTGEKRSYTIQRFPKEQYNNQSALEAALRQAVIDYSNLEVAEAQRIQAETAFEAKEQAHMARAKAVNKVMVDPKTGAWNFEYLHSEHDFEEGDTYDKVTFRKRSMYPPNMFDVTIKSSIKAKGNDVFEYSYVVSNGKNSKQQIISFGLGNKLNLTTTTPPKKVYSKESEQYVETKEHDTWFKKQLEICRSRVVPSKVVEVHTYCNESGSGYGLYALTTKNWTDEKGELRSSYAGLKPGQSWDQMKITVPALPGVFMADAMGDNDEQKVPQAILDVESPAKDKLEQLLNTIGKEVPVIAPQIAIPKPYSGAELARRIKADMQTWIVKKPGYELQTGNELITPNTLVALNRQFDLLIPALERKDKAAVRGIAQTMLTQLFTPHTDLDHYKFIADDEIHNTKPKRNLIISADASVKNTAAMEPLHRVAARALGFNLMYLITQSEKSR